MINQIKSKYILNHINNFIEDNYFWQKLFAYSKCFKNKLDIDYSYAYENFFTKIKFDLNRYLYKDETKYEKDKLREEYDKFILENKLNKEQFEKIIYEVINNKKQMNEEHYINIDSPLFDILSKTEFFDKNYIIYISQKNIDECKLLYDYIILFNKINNLNIKYSSISFVFYKKTKLIYLVKLNINFKNIRKLRLEYKGDEAINNESSYKNENILNLCKNLEQLILIGNDNPLKLLVNANFKELKELDLSGYKFTDIKVLEQIKFEKLEKLNLSGRKFSDINILENNNFKGLKELDLSWNKISDLRIFEKAKFDKLNKLNLDGNNITDINFLENVVFNDLKELYLSRNEIEDIEVLKNVKFDKLKKLNLGANKISDINILEDVNFKDLKELGLYENRISDIEALGQLHSYKLEILDLHTNKISEINSLEKGDFRELKKLYL